ncbi:MAG: hypothetical protein K6A42_07345 [Treponema sp.]|nr:hypothetical protein [Treponema sp.]
MTNVENQLINSFNEDELIENVKFFKDKNKVVFDIIKQCETQNERITKENPSDDFVAALLSFENGFARKLIERIRKMKEDVEYELSLYNSCDAGFVILKDLRDRWEKKQ